MEINKIEEKESSPLSSVELKSTIAEFFQPNEYYNGAKFDTYCWSQTINDLEIHVRLPKHIKSSRNLNIRISSDFIKIQDKVSGNIILEGKMHSKCKYNDAVWSISNGKLQITLGKLKLHLKRIFYT